MAAKKKHRLFLVPGFFGFTNLGELFYFSHLADHLEHRFEQAGRSVDVVRVHTHPTASLQTRAYRLLDALREAPDDNAALHIIGHSSGGLDARLILSPRPDLEEAFDVARLTERVRSLITVSTPHRGAPLADYFASRFGGGGLWLLSVITLTALRFEQTPPMRAFVKLGSLMTRMDDVVGGDNSIVDQVFRELLDDFSPDRRESVRELFDQVRGDQALLKELAPDNMVDFDPPLRDGIRAASIVTRARRPSLRQAVDAGLNPYAQMTHALYRGLFQWAGKGFDDDVAPELHNQLVAVHGKEPPRDANDGIVPTWSQPFGEILAAPYADHLDCIGHFKDRDHDPPHVDWLVSGSGFTRSRFEAVWDTAVEWLLK